MDYKDFDYKLLGMWEDILTRYGIEIPKWKGKNTINHPCPCCGGDDRAHWRETDGRLSLYCRNCTGDTMKSAEDVIQEVCGISFPELVRDLAGFADHREPEDIKRAKKRVQSKVNRNTPVGHKQDHEKSEKFMSEQDCAASHIIFNRFSVQYPFDIKANKNSVFFDIRNENGVIVNVFAFYIDRSNVVQSKFLAGGLSYGAWHTIPKCEHREPDGVTYCAGVIDGLHYWWETGKEVRIAFDEMNILFMVSCGIIDLNDKNISVLNMDVEQLPCR